MAGSARLASRRKRVEGVAVEHEDPGSLPGFDRARELGHCHNLWRWGVAVEVQVGDDKGAPASWKLKLQRGQKVIRGLVGCCRRLRHGLNMRTAQPPEARTTTETMRLRTVVSLAAREASRESRCRSGGRAYLLACAGIGHPS